ncbi:MAG: hypothetical protein AAF202_04825, partial [Pseudomonadota bacterium]
MFFTGRFERYSALSLAAVFLLGFFIQGCTLRKPKSEKPVPNIQNVKKSFFLNSGSGKGFSIQNATPKTFLCGWAAESSSGEHSPWLMTNYNYAAHCNVQFRIFKDQLVAYLVNPSRTTDKWLPLISIGISKHFYRENPRDANGRDSINVAEVERSDWEARPQMALNLASVKIHRESPFYCANGAYSTQGVLEDTIDWDKENGFLGFTLKMTNDCGWGHGYTGNVRFNFMQFEHNPNFEKTPYNAASSSHFNILHLLGTRHDGMNKEAVEIYGAKWDLNKKHTIYINQFPEEYQHIGVEVVELWNDAFEEIYKEINGDSSSVRPFVPKVENLKHSFDLRKSALTWIQDKREHYGAPLGVGMVNSDVRNGEIIWGGVTIWGETIRKMVNAYQPTASLFSGQFADESVNLALANHRAFNPNAQAPFQNLVSNLYIDPAESLDSGVHIAKERFAEIKNQYDIDLEAGDAPPEQLLEELKFILRADVLENIQVMVGPLLQAQLTLQQTAEQSKEIFFSENFDPLNYSTTSSLADTAQMLSAIPMAKPIMTAEQLANPSALTVDNISTSIESSLDFHYSTNAMFDYDRTVGEVATGWAQAIHNGHNVHQVRKSVIKDLVLHEVGHMVGLGHNFKENIIPPVGTVPKHHIDHLASFNNDEQGYIQMTTVMGYRSGYTEAVTPYEHLKPGPMDKLVLRYLYGKQVAMFQYGDTTSEDFTFSPIPDDGKILTYIPPEERVEGEWYPSYFPACNDYYASTGGDPYCKRWDRGGDAISLVRNHFRQFRGMKD